MSAVGIGGRVATIRTWFDGLAMRERILLAVTLVAVIWMLWSFAVQQVVDKQRQSTINAINSVRAQVQAAVSEQRMLSGSGRADPNSLLRDRRDALLLSIASLEERLQRAVESFVEPDKVPELLAELMRAHEGLEFKGVTRLPTEPLIAETGAQTEAAQAPSDTPTLYRHPIRIDFEGHYFAVLDYLNALEASDWRLNWRSLNYEVRDYPKAHVSIEVDTLSRSRDWLGV